MQNDIHKNAKRFSNSSFLKIGVTALGLSFGTTLFAADAAVEAALKKNGADAIKTLEFSGAGRWYQFGQSPAPGTDWPAFEVKNYTASINFDEKAARVQQTRLQIVEPNRERPVPVEQKPDQYVSGDIAWNLAPPQGAAPGTPAAPQPQPAAVSERQAEIWTTPQGFLKAAQANNATSKKKGKSTVIEFTHAKSKYEGVINSNGELEQVKTWIDNPILGDTLVEISYSQYKDFNGVGFPTKIVKVQGGSPVLDLAINQVKVNQPVALAVPAEVKSNPAPAVAVTSTEIAPGVHYLQGGSHHSIVIDQKDHIVVVEAPLNEERSLAVIAKIKELIPNKPITHIINSHHHFDHSGGLRTYVDAGATVVTHELNKPYYEKAWKQARTINPDQLAGSKAAAKFQTFKDKLVLNDGQRPIEIHTLKGNGHNDAFAVVYLPKEKILVEADAYTPPAPNAPLPTSVNPFAKNLYENINRLNLTVEKIAPLHGRLVSLSDLESFISLSTAKN